MRQKWLLRIKKQEASASLKTVIKSSIMSFQQTNHRFVAVHVCDVNILFCSDKTMAASALAYLHTDAVSDVKYLLLLL